MKEFEKQGFKIEKDNPILMRPDNDKSIFYKKVLGENSIVVEKTVKGKFIMSMYKEGGDAGVIDKILEV